MCGIAGKYSFSSSSRISVDSIHKMIGIINYRGPDESGIYVDDSIGLGHARLSIIDLAGGVQPIHNEDSTLWIVYNGEIFNYPELKADLEKKGHRFYTTTDTEVLLHLYEEKGTACLNELNGQFAFAIWDSGKKELLLARDRVGIRPLFYSMQNETCFFASEIKAIFANQEISREIDASALDEVFTFWTTLPGRTVFKNIHELPPGHYLKIKNNNIKVQKYWEIPFYSSEDQFDWSANQYIERIQELLTDAIRIRLRADVPVGCYLSGGLDSSGVTSLVVKNFDNNVRTFGIRFEEKAFDEGEHQNLMVSYLQTDHSEMIATNQLIGASLPQVLWHCEKPLLRTGPVPLYLLSDTVHQNKYKVVLTGEGADEVFGGYNIFREAKVRNFWAKQPDSKWRGMLVGKLYPYIFKNSRLWKMQQAFFASGLDRYDDPFFSHLIRWQNTSKIKTFFADDVHAHATFSLDSYNGALTSMLPDAFPNWDCLSKAQFLEMSLFLSNYLLSSQGDRVAMAHSVEIRLPYLDYRLIEFMGRVPSHLKIRGLNEKYLLKKAFQGSLPEAITNRPKHPYRAPIGQSFFYGNIADQTHDLLSEYSLSQTGFFDARKVGNLIQKFKNPDAASEVDNMAIMGILSTQIIHQKFISDFPQFHLTKKIPTLLIDKRSN